MQTVFLTEQIHPDAQALLKENFTVVQGTATAEADIIRDAAGCAGILIRSAKITAAVMDALPELRVVAKHGIGVDNIDVAHATQRGILVVNAPVSNINAVAEHTVALLFAASKRIVRMDRATREGRFADRGKYPTTELRGRVVGLLGLGKIARLVAAMLSGFGVTLLGSDPFVSQADVDALGVKVVSNGELLAQSDFLCVHAPLTADTRHMLGAAQFQAMKNTAYIVNAARGPVIDEPALIEALRSGAIAGAALDVFEDEPPAGDNALFGLENAVLSPHNAALSDGALLAMAMHSAQGITEYLTGKPVTWPVNPTVLEQSKS